MVGELLGIEGGAGDDWAASRSMAETVSALLAALEARDPFTRGHSLRVARYGAAFAERLGVEARIRRHWQVAALLHDVGKLGMPDSILRKPGPLSRAEFTVMRRHPAIGAAILQPVAALRPMIPIILHHHERWDGRGYPGGLSGEAIPLGSRVLSVADAIDAMLARRSYQPTRDVRSARSELLACRGTQFDPAVVDIAAAWLDESGHDLGAREDVGERAEATTPTPHPRERPLSSPA
jgi:putative nucleotidyltransferase with HDIG domain